NGDRSPPPAQIRTYRFPIFGSCLRSTVNLTDPLQRTGQTGLAQCPGFVALGRVSLGPIPSLHYLRRVAVRFVRQLLRYYGSVRLPTIVHHRCSSLDFPRRSAFADNRGISQSPFGMFPCMLGVSDLAGFSCNIGRRCSRFRLPFAITTSAPGFCVAISRLNTQPARTSINVPPALL